MKKKKKKLFADERKSLFFNKTIFIHFYSSIVNKCNSTEIIFLHWF